MYLQAFESIALIESKYTLDNIKLRLEHTSTCWIFIHVLFEFFYFQRNIMFESFFVISFYFKINYAILAK